MIPECFIVKYRVSYKNIISVRTYIYSRICDKNFSVCIMHLGDVFYFMGDIF